MAGGPDAPTLALTNTTRAQSGQRYRVRVSNGAGSVTSNAALLTVNAAPSAPQFTTQPVSQSIVVGAAATFLVAATGTPAPTLQWRINGASLANGAQASGACAGAVVTGANGSTLALTAVPIGCSGAVFSAVASNGVSPDATSNGADAHGQRGGGGAEHRPAAGRRDRRGSGHRDLHRRRRRRAHADGAVAAEHDAGVTWANITGATSHELHHAGDRAGRQRQALPRGVHQRLGQREQ